MYTKTMDNKIKEFIENEAKMGVITIINGEKIFGKILNNLHLIVKVNVNLYHEEYFNGDICEVLGETLDGRLILKRIEDNKENIISKNQVSSAEWISYKF